MPSSGCGWVSSKIAGSFGNSTEVVSGGVTNIHENGTPVPLMVWLQLTFTTLPVCVGFPNDAHSTLRLAGSDTALYSSHGGIVGLAIVTFIEPFKESSTRIGW